MIGRLAQNNARGTLRDFRAVQALTMPAPGRAHSSVKGYSSMPGRQLRPTGIQVAHANGSLITSETYAHANTTAAANTAFIASMASNGHSLLGA